MEWLISFLHHFGARCWSQGLWLFFAWPNKTSASEQGTHSPALLLFAAFVPKGVNVNTSACVPAAARCRQNKKTLSPRLLITFMSPEMSQQNYTDVRRILSCRYTHRGYYCTIIMLLTGCHFHFFCNKLSRHANRFSQGAQQAIKQHLILSHKT